MSHEDVFLKGERARGDLRLLQCLPGFWLARKVRGHEAPKSRHMQSWEWSPQAKQSPSQQQAEWPACTCPGQGEVWCPNVAPQSVLLLWPQPDHDCMSDAEIRASHQTFVYKSSTNLLLIKSKNRHCTYIGLVISSLPLASITYNGVRLDFHSDFCAHQHSNGCGGKRYEW